MFQGKLPLLAGSKDVDQLLKDIHMPDDQEIVGITERLVEQEPVTAATVSLSEHPVDTITNGVQTVQTLDKVQCTCSTNVEAKPCKGLISATQAYASHLSSGFFPKEWLVIKPCIILHKK